MMLNFVPFQTTPVAGSIVEVETTIFASFNYAQAEIISAEYLLAN